MRKPAKLRLALPPLWYDPLPWELRQLRDLPPGSPRCDPGDPLALWECECQPWPPTSIPRDFLKKIRSCDWLLALYQQYRQRHQAWRLHPVFYLLHGIHCQPFDRIKTSTIASIANLKKLEQQRTERSLQLLRRFHKAVYCDGGLSVDNKLLLLNTIDEVRESESRGHGSSFIRPRGRGAPPHRFKELLNVHLLLLSEAVQALEERYYWREAAALARHFYPGIGPTFRGTQLRARVKLFRSQRQGFEHLPPGSKAAPCRYLQALRQELKRKVSLLLKRHTHHSPPVR